MGRVVIGTPCYGGQVRIEWAECYAETRLLLASQGVQTAFVGTKSESLVQRGRDLIAANFLAIEHATHLFFIDADIEWEPKDVLKLLSHDVECICALYPKKTLPIEYPFHPLVDENGHSNRDPRTGRIEIGNAATGFLCLKRAAFLRYIEAYPESKIRAMQNVQDHVLPWLYDFFPAQLEDGILWSEDYGFCRRFRAAGGQVWMDPYIKLKHIGAYTFEGDPAKIIRMPATLEPVSAAA